MFRKLLHICLLVSLPLCSLTAATNSNSSLDSLNKDVDRTPYVDLEYTIQQRFEKIGQIIASWRKAKYLRDGDVVYLKMNRPTSVGDKFTIFKNLGNVEKPGSLFSTSGERIHILGYVRVTAVKPGIIVAKIYGAKEDIDRGNWIAPLIDRRVKVDPHNCKKDVRGIILSAAGPNNLIGSYQFTFLNKGSADGLNVNDKLYIYRKGTSAPGVDADLPEVNVAELVVVATTDKYATAYTLGGMEHFEAGAHFKTAVPETHYLDTSAPAVEDSSTDGPQNQ